SARARIDRSGTVASGGHESDGQGQDVIADELPGGRCRVSSVNASNRAGKAFSARRDQKREYGQVAKPVVERTPRSTAVGGLEHSTPCGSRVPPARPGRVDGERPHPKVGESPIRASPVLSRVIAPEDATEAGSDDAAGVRGVQTQDPDVSGGEPRAARGPGHALIPAPENSLVGGRVEDSRPSRYDDEAADVPVECRGSRAEPLLAAVTRDEDARVGARVDDGPKDRIHREGQDREIVQAARRRAPVTATIDTLVHPAPETAQIECVRFHGVSEQADHDPPE